MLYNVHRITTKPVGLKWFDTLTFTCDVDYHAITARKRTSADLMLGQHRGQVRWEGDIDQSALEHLIYKLFNKMTCLSRK